MAKEKKDKIVHTAIERPIWKQLALLAVERETSISNLVRLAIQKMLESEKVNE